MFDILANVSDPATTQPVLEGTMTAALKVSGISLIGIFAVMAFFALSIVILGKACPERESGGE